MRFRWILLAAVSMCALSGYGDQRATYLLHCGGCHLPDGRGNPPEVPSLRDELGKIVEVPGGRAYLVQVPGSSQAPVTDEELTNIINWILLEFNAATLEPGFTKLTVQEVGKARRQTIADPLKHRAAIWRPYEE